MKHLIILFFAVLALSACSSKNESIQGENAKSFSVKATEVDEIYLFDTENRKVHLKKEGEKWRLNDQYYARPDAIKTLLETMEYVKYRNPVASRAHENMVKNLIAKNVKVEILSKGKNIMNYFVGNQTQDGTGTYFLKQDPESGENAEKLAVVELPGFNGYLTPRYITQESLWRNRTLFQYDNGEISEITVNYPTQKEKSFSIKVSEGQVQLNNISGEPESNANDLALKKYLLNYKQVNFEAIATKDMSVEIDSLLETDEFFSISIKETSGNTNEIKAYRRKPIKEELDINGEPLEFDTDRLFALQNGKKELLVIQYYVFDALTLKKQDLLNQ